MPMDWSPFQDLMDRLDAARAELGFGSNQDCFYRGHTCESHALQPTLLRDGRDAWDPERLRHLEKKLFFEFRARARQLHGHALSGWDYLAYMRHHGLPTRLLDWTESLAAALYFAAGPGGQSAPSAVTENTDNEDEGARACIWLLNPYRLNEGDLASPEDLGWDAREQRYYDYHELLLEPDYIDWERPVAVYPMQRSPRMAAQRGWFTIHGRDGRSLNEMEHVREHCLRCVPLRNAAPVTRALLGMMGIDKYLLFPDLDSLADTLRWRYEVR